MGQCRFLRQRTIIRLYGSAPKMYAVCRGPKPLEPEEGCSFPIRGSSTHYGFALGRSFTFAIALCNILLLTSVTSIQEMKGNKRN
jgi:hypothetical protein